MTARLRKEVQIFKEVYQHSRFGDHVQEVRTRTCMHKEVLQCSNCLGSLDFIRPIQKISFIFPSQVRFQQPICLTGIKVGAAPGSGGLAEQPHVHLFALDLSTMSAARFALLTGHCSLPPSGTKAVRLEVSRHGLEQLLH
jgi:hypothetical protein